MASSRRIKELGVAGRRSEEYCKPCMPSAIPLSNTYTLTLLDRPGADAAPQPQLSQHQSSVVSKVYVLLFMILDPGTVDAPQAPLLPRHRLTQLQPRPPRRPAGPSVAMRWDGVRLQLQSRLSNHCALATARPPCAAAVPCQGLPTVRALQPPAMGLTQAARFSSNCADKPITATEGA
jgi:hypothetical protein